MANIPKIKKFALQVLRTEKNISTFSRILSSVSDVTFNPLTNRQIQSFGDSYGHQLTSLRWLYCCL